ncbi:hypothetical protein FPQ18DRAFT_308912 [Pyronema domesticum]|nr:hypothetical protein FPQ18DRAFT_308912 [Pyronema domesticum]
MTDTSRRVLLLVTWVHTNSELICEFPGETGRSGIIWTIHAALRSRSRGMRNIVLTSAKRDERSRLLLCPATVYIHTINEYFLPQATAAADSGPEDPENQKMQRTARLARAPSPPTKTSDSRCEVGNSPTETFLRFLRRGLLAVDRGPRFLVELSGNRQGPVEGVAPVCQGQELVRFELLYLSTTTCQDPNDLLKS